MLVLVCFVLSHFGDFFRHAQTIFNDDQVRVFSKQVATIFHMMGYSMIGASSVLGLLNYFNAFLRVAVTCAHWASE